MKMNNALLKHLESFVTNRRSQLFDNVIENRTRYITVVLEDIYQPHNASAVLRTCDCFGIQDVHIIENINEYNVNPDVAMGSSKWLNLIRYNTGSDNTPEAIKNLKQNGYRIVATTPYSGNVILDDFDLKKGKTALFFGTELKGLSQNVIDNADEFLKIPMYGFTESFNISVSAAIILHSLTNKMRQDSKKWQLSNQEKMEIKIQWLKNSIKSSQMIVEHFEKLSS